MTLSTILVILFAIALAGGSGYYLSYNFNRSTYSQTDTSGDFGAPRGGFFALLSGCLIGMFFFGIVGKYLFMPEAVSYGMMASMIAGAVGGIAGMIRGVAKRP